MAQKRAQVTGVGEVLLQKRRGTKNMRLSLSPSGEVRVGLPTWVPYGVGLQFVKARREWIEKHRRKIPPSQLVVGGLVGKSHRLRYIQAPGLGRTVSTRVSEREVVIKSALAFDSPEVQAKARLACERALKRQAEKLLPQRLEQIANSHGYSYKSMGIKKLTSRWGSCSSKGHITLSLFLMQLPWELIDYVMVHELAHTRYLNHSREFWQEVEHSYPKTKEARRLIKTYGTSISTINTL